jgi:alpha/beta superfamily hydrolase
MKEIPIAFHNRNQQIIGILHMPKRKHAPAILICHGLFRNKSDKLLVDISRSLCKSGFIVLRFDFRGCGDSQGRTDNYCFDSEISDIKAAIKFLHKIPEFNGKTGILGHSHGGTTVILASIIIKPKCIVILAPVAYPKLRWTKTEITKIEKNGFLWYKDFKVGKKMWLNAKRYNVIQAIKKIKSPIAILCGTKDTEFISDSKVLFQSANKPKELNLIKNADHFFTHINHRNKAINLINRWFKKYL